MTWRDEAPECHCRIHEPVTSEEPEYNDHDRKLLADVRARGWHLVQIPDDAVTRGWVFSVGMWHTLGSPELAIFGLETNHGGHALNDIGDAIQAGRSIGPDDVLNDILAEGRLVSFRPVHDSWYRLLFGYAIWFTQRPPLPFVQVVWADPDGRFPWEPAAGDSCRVNQPSLWIPANEHPTGGWTGVTLEGWKFPVRPDVTAFTTARVASGTAPIALVVHDADGSWQFIDAAPWQEADIRTGHLGHIVVDDPSMNEVADLPRGWRAEREGPGHSWRRSPLVDRAESPDRPSTRR